MPRPAPQPRLTRREQEVLAELCGPIVNADNVFTEPASIHQIAQALFVSDAAVKQHLLHLYDKFQILGGATERRRIQLANTALRDGIVRLARPSTPDSAADPLAEGRTASAQRNWQTAYALLVQADSAHPLGASDLERLGEAGWFSDHHNESERACIRAHAAYLQVGDHTGAAHAAITLAFHNICRLNLAVAAGWTHAASRLLTEHGECKETGDLAALVALIQLAGGELDGALESARLAVAIGNGFAHPDALALGLTLQGSALIRLGRVDEGLANLDEGMANAVGGLLSAPVVGLVYCRTLGACLHLLDYRRAAEWADEVDRRCDSALSAGFPADCATHRVAIRILRGQWVDGEREAIAAATVMFRFDLNHTAEAFNELGEIKLRQGQLAVAEDAFARAHELGSPAQPGLALVLLRGGDPASAVASIDAALAGVGADQLTRARLLPAQVEIALAAGNPQQASRAADALVAIAEHYRTIALKATAAYARGTVQLAVGDAAGGVSTLREALRLWMEIDGPYEAARSRKALASGLAALGDHSGSKRELHAARVVFHQLGARLDLG